MRSARRMIPLLACLLAGAYLTAGAFTPADQQEVGEIGSLVSAFSLETWDGKTFTEADLKNKVTIIAFWYPT